MVEVSCFSTATADAINTAKPCRVACDKDGNILTKDADILKRLHVYGMGLCNVNIATVDDAFDHR